MHFFRNMSQSIRAQVSNLFGVRNLAVFESWIDCTVDLRNFCAHHDRLFNRSFPKQPATMLRPRMVPVTSVAEEKKKLRSILECLDYAIFTRTGSQGTLEADVRTLILANPHAVPAESGF